MQTFTTILFFFLNPFLFWRPKSSVFACSQPLLDNPVHPGILTQTPSIYSLTGRVPRSWVLGKWEPLAVLLPSTCWTLASPPRLVSPRGGRKRALKERPLLFQSFTETMWSPTKPAGTREKAERGTGVSDYHTSYITRRNHHVCLLAAWDLYVGKEYLVSSLLCLPVSFLNVWCGLLDWMSLFPQRGW